MSKMIDAEALKKEVSKAPVWTSLTIIEMIDEIAKRNDKPKDERRE